MPEPTTGQLAEALALLRELVETEPLGFDANEDPACAYCREVPRYVIGVGGYVHQHADSCPWLMAKRLLKGEAE